MCQDKVHFGPITCGSSKGMFLKLVEMYFLLLFTGKPKGNKPFQPLKYIIFLTERNLVLRSGCCQPVKRSTVSLGSMTEMWWMDMDSPKRCPPKGPRVPNSCSCPHGMSLVAQKMAPLVEATLRMRHAIGARQPHAAYLLQELGSMSQHRSLFAFFLDGTPWIDEGARDNRATGIPPRDESMCWTHISA